MNVKPRVFLDLHDVTAGYVWAMIERHGWPVNWSGNLAEMWPWVDITQHFRPSSHAVFLLGLKPMEFSQYGAWLIHKSDKYRLVYLSAIKKGGIEEVVTSKWLRGNGYPPAPLVAAGGRPDKTTYIVENSGYRDIVIDDHPDFLKASFDHTSAVTVVYDTPWNRGTRGHQRVKSWRDLVTLFEKDEWEGRGEELG